MDSNDAPVLISKQHRVTTVTLNRPRAINALTTEMIELGIDAFERAWQDESQAIIITGAGDRGLCGGGDIKEMSHNNASEAHLFIEREYTLDLMTHESPVPVVGLMDGITMGGGIGLTGHATVRIVTERSRLAMPETRIGIVPDVGGHLLLAHAPGRLGEYLAVTSAPMTGADAIALGFADYYVPSSELESLVVALRQGVETAADVTGIIERFAQTPEPSELLASQDWIDALFDTALEGDLSDLASWSVAASKRLLDETRDAYPDLHQTIREMSPTSIAVTLAQIARTRLLELNLESVLADDLRVLTRLFQRPDFVEGVRARVIDKDNAPAWNPATIEALEVNTIAQIIDPAD